MAKVEGKSKQQQRAELTRQFDEWRELFRVSLTGAVGDPRAAPLQRSSARLGSRTSLSESCGTDESRMRPSCTHSLQGRRRSSSIGEPVLVEERT